MTGLPALNERRIVTVLSVDMVQSTRLVAGLDPETAQQLLDESFAHIRAAVTAVDGMVITFNGDGALAVFGWPYATERHADLALQAAWDIQSSPLTDRMIQSRLMRQVRYRIGIDSGLVALRRIELDLSSRLDIVGDSVHIAAQLQKTAPIGAILVSPQSIRLCRAELSIEPLATVEKTHVGAQGFLLKARPETGPSRERDRNARTPVFGRETEIARLSQLADFGQPACLALIADPGLGKSRLATMASELCEDAGATVILHQGQSIGQLSAHAAIRRVLLSNLPPRGKDIAERIVNAFYASGGLPRDIETVLQVLLPSRTGNTAQLVSMTETRLARILAAMMLEVLSARPTLLIVEDIHNIDAESRLVLRFLAAMPNRASLAILVTGRPEARDAITDIAAEIVTLEPLSIEHSQELIRAFQSGVTVTPSLEAEIVRQAGGNPFVIEQLLQSLGETTAEPGLPLPRTVESLIHARLDRLSEPERKLVQGLALLGEQIDVALAERVLGSSARLGSGQLRSLQNLGFVRASEDGVIRFRHALIATACASSVGRDMRQTTHLRAIHAIENLNEDLSGHHSRLAHHALEAGETQTALRYLWSAARRARRLAATQTLMSIVEQALAICEQIGEAAEIQFVDFVLLAFETFHLSGEIERIDPYLLRAAEFAAGQGRLKQVCIANCHQGISLWYRGRFADGVDLMRATVLQAQFLDHLPLRFAARFTLAQLLHNLAQIDEAYQLVTEMAALLKGDLELARLGALGLPASLSEAHAGYYSIEVGHYDLAKAHSARALAIALRGEDAYSEVLARIAYGRACLMTGHDRDAVGHLRTAHGLVEAYGFDPARPNTAGLLSTALSRTGDTNGALALVRERISPALLARTGSYEKHYFFCGLGEALFADGAQSEGLASIDRAIETGQLTSNACILVQSFSLKAALLERIDPASLEAARLRHQAAAISARHGLATPPDPGFSPV